MCNVHTKQMYSSHTKQPETQDSKCKIAEVR